MTGTHGMHGREELVALGAARLDAAVSGTGHLLLLTGEAGIGKTRLLRALEARASATGAAVVRAGASPSDRELPAAVLLDLAHGLARSPHHGHAQQGHALLDLLQDGGTSRGDQTATDGTDGTGGPGDAHRRRRLLVLDTADRLASLADQGPLLLSLEDLHWADDLSLDVVARLAQRLPSLPLLVVGTIRTDELPVGTPVRPWRSRVLLQRTGEEVAVPRLGRQDTERLVAELLPDGPLPAGLVDLLHRRSGGVPLHVEELAAAAARGRLDPSFVPDTLAEAVRHRFGTLSPASREVAVAAAVVRRSVDVDLLRDVSGRPADEVAVCLDELLDRQFVEEEAPGWFGFRHALVRDAVELGAPLADRRRLHAAVADAARRRPELGGDAYRSAHHEVAGDLAEASAAAERGAARASALSAHQEALDLLHRAVRCRRDDDPARLARLLALRAEEAAAVDHVEQAARDYAEARRVLLGLGDRVGAAALLPGLVAARHLLGDDLASRVRLLEDGMAGVASTSSGASEVREAVTASLQAATAAAFLVDDRLDDAVAAGERAVALLDAGRATAPAVVALRERTRLDAAATLGSVLAFSGRVAEGVARMAEAVHAAREQGAEAQAARAYRLLGSSASTLVEYDTAERWLVEGIEYAERTEQGGHRHYMAAHLAHVLWCRGRWAGADDAVRRVLADGEGGVTTRITAQHVVGFLALGRGRHDEARSVLTEARLAGEEMHELQRFGPAVWGLAEDALLRGDAADAVGLTRTGADACRAVADAAALFPLAVTGTRARLAVHDVAGAQAWVEEVSGALRRRGVPGTLPAADHAAGLLALAAGRTGRARTLLGAAADAWSARDRWWELQWCRLDLARCALAGNRRGDAATLVAQVREAATAVGSVPLADAADALAGRLDDRDTAPPWAPLTLRELEVARLVAQGMTNREIAGVLRVTVRTAGAHLEHISAKLGTRSRAEVAAWVTALDAAVASGGG